jgi:hypothetical protein
VRTLTMPSPPSEPVPVLGVCMPVPAVAVVVGMIANAGNLRTNSSLSSNSCEPVSQTHDGQSQ